MTNRFIRLARLFASRLTRLIRVIHETIFSRLDDFLNDRIDNLEEKVTNKQIGMGRCICCGGKMVMHSKIFATIPFVYLTCEMKHLSSAEHACDLYDKDNNQCIVKSCPFFVKDENEDSIEKRVIILFNMVFLISKYIEEYDQCVVDVTIDAIDAIFILHALKNVIVFRCDKETKDGSSPDKKITYLLFAREFIRPKPEQSFQIVDVKDWQERIENMNCGFLVQDFVNRIKNKKEFKS